MPPRRIQKSYGFCLVELVAVLALGSLLLGLLLPAAPAARGAAADIQCQNNLHVLAVAMHNFESAYKQLPPLVDPMPGSNQNGTFLFYALPFVEEVALHKSSKDKDGSYVVWLNNTWSQPIKLFACPSDPWPPSNGVYNQWLATTNYAGNWQVFGKGGNSLARIPDGTAVTIMVAERYQLCDGTPCAWGYPERDYRAPMFAYYSEAKFQVKPAEDRCDPALPQAFHRGGIHIALCSAAVRTVSDSISPQTWWYACTPNGGEVLGKDW
jgi:type II secretory pathway pseudopilin PulG